MVSDVTLSGQIASQANTGASTASLAADFDQFLSLLTTQLQYQDPLSPMETNEFTNQLVAFSGVEQQINSNEKLDNLISLQLGSVLGNALGYVGLDASYVGSEFYADGTRDITINYALDSQAIDTKLRIVDEAGEIIYETEGNTASGSHAFTWDGTDKEGNPVEPGTYAIRIDSLDIDDNAVGSTTVVEGRVDGVETQDGLIFLIVGERAVNLGNVLNVKAPQNGTSNTGSTDESTTDDSSDSSTDTSSTQNDQTT